MKPRTHRRAVILSLGDELTLGQTLDTNARWISRRLVDRGILPVEHVTLPDDLDAIVRALERAARQADLIISTGGLGPTLDDLTRDALARAMGDTLVEDPASLEQIRAWFASRGRPMVGLNAVQALRPTRAAAIWNKWGTAPGLVGEIEGAMCYCLPGPPAEMTAMFAEAVEPALAPPGGIVIQTRALHTVGLGESEIATRLGALMRRDAAVLVGTTASDGIVSIRIRREGPSADEGAIDQVAAQCRDAVAGHVAWEGDPTAAQALVEALRARGQRVGVVESCTGGLLGATITDVPGSSDVFLGGLITYANELKRSLAGVDVRVLDAQGAVSAAVAQEMARGGLRATGADHCVAVTGIAGPGGGSEAKPVGTVFVCHGRSDGLTDCRQLRLTGDRGSIRTWSVNAALAMLLFACRGEAAPGLLRQVR